MIVSKRAEYDQLLENVISKIDNGTITTEDFNGLISTMIGESTPEAIRDRLRRRTLRNATHSHIDDAGHQQLDTPTMADRIQPKRKPSNQQSHGRSSIAHRHSARTQERTMSKSKS